MSGHSKWATTKHKKAGIDAKRGKLFAKLIKNIEVAARTGGGDPAGNPTLFDAIQKAKKTSVPNDNIDRAVKRGAGLEAGGVDYQGITYEGYAAGGVAVLIECLTDNKNRSAMEVRTAMTRNGGSMADPGSVSYLFSRKGVIVVPKSDGVDEDAVLMAVLDAVGAVARGNAILTTGEIRQLSTAASGLGLPGYFDGLRPTSPQDLIAARLVPAPRAGGACGDCRAAGHHRAACPELAPAGR
jgi:YebC/PmpR family DNA-binding regulatory protein